MLSAPQTAPGHLAADRQLGGALLEQAERLPYLVNLAGGTELATACDVVYVADDAQIAALFGTAIVTMLPTIQFSGLTTPVEALEGAGYWIGQGYPATYFILICRGAFTKGLGFADLWQSLLALAAFIPLLTFASVALLKKQEK